MSICEKTMRRALGLDTSYQRAKPIAKPTQGYLVRLSVRCAKDGMISGAIKTFEKTYNVLSPLEAECLAKKDCKKKKLAVWAVLEVIKVED